MGDPYLRKCTSRITAMAQELGRLFELKASMVPKGSCFDMSDDLQLYTMVREAVR